MKANYQRPSATQVAREELRSREKKVISRTILLCAAAMLNVGLSPRTVRRALQELSESTAKSYTEYGEDADYALVSQLRAAGLNVAMPGGSKK